MNHIKEKLKHQVNLCNIHADRIQRALTHIEAMLPFTSEKIAKLSDEALGFIELMNSRLSKLQDTMGAQIFPLTLELLSERNEQQSMIDRLNLLERLGFIEKASFWQTLRELRNDIVHEYENDPDEQMLKIHRAVDASKKLLALWQHFLACLASRNIDV